MKLQRLVKLSAKIDGTIPNGTTLEEFAALGKPYERMAAFFEENDLNLRFYLRIKKDLRVLCDHCEEIIEYRVIWFLFHRKSFMSDRKPDFARKINWEKLIKGDIDDSQ